MELPIIERTYRIQGHGHEFATGFCADGRQVVMGLLCPHLVAYFFDAAGRLQGEEHRLWDKPAPKMLNDGPYRTYDPEFQSALALQQAVWRKQIGFRAGTIDIRPFFDPEHPVGITPIPAHLEPDQWDDLDDDECQWYGEERAEWLANDRFVWWWAKDYYMGKDGAVEST